jgi:hypothetical protein
MKAADSNPTVLGAHNGVLNAAKHETDVFLFRNIGRKTTSFSPIPRGFQA